MTGVQVNDKGVHVEHKGLSFSVVCLLLSDNMTVFPFLQFHDAVGIMPDISIIQRPMSAHSNIVDTLRTLLGRFHVILTKGSRVIAIFVPAPQFLITVT